MLVILLEILNAHSTRWGNPERPRDNAYWEELMDQFDLVYAGNKQPTRGSSTIDLLFVTGETLRMDTDFRAVDEDEHATGSDHEMILWQTKSDSWRPTYDDSSASKEGGWKIADLIYTVSETAKNGEVHPMVKTWKNEVQIWESNPLMTGDGKDKVEERAVEIERAIIGLLNSYAKRARITARSKRWWTEEIQEK